MQNHLVPLFSNQLQKTAPSVFATQPIEGVSDRYRFIPTSHVVNLLDTAGWHPVSVRQVMSRTEDNLPCIFRMILTPQSG